MSTSASTHKQQLRAVSVGWLMLKSCGVHLITYLKERPSDTERLNLEMEKLQKQREKMNKKKAKMADSDLEVS